MSCRPPTMLAVAVALATLALSSAASALCTDTDAADDMAFLGKVVDNSGSSFYDACSSNRVVQVNCDRFGAVVFGTATICPTDQTCSGGVCMTPPPATCGGVVMAPGGTCFGGFYIPPIIPTDPCANWVAPDDKCNTYACSSGSTIITASVSCTSGRYCVPSTGLCQPICTDSDSGNSETFQGQLTLNGVSSSTDSCTADGKLVQVGCNATDGTATSSTSTCSKGICQNGVCVDLCLNKPADTVCTSYSCDPLTGVSTPTQNPTPTNPPACMEYTGVCANNAFVTQPKTCPTGQVCKTDTSGVSACKDLCLNKPADTVCTSYSCDPLTGISTPTQNPTPTNPPACMEYTGVCSNNTFVTQPKTCPSGQVCKTDTSGVSACKDQCLNKPADTVCTSYSCDPLTGISTPTQNPTPTNPPACMEYTGVCANNAFVTQPKTCPTGQQCSPSTGLCETTDKCASKDCGIGNYCVGTTGECSPICIDSDPNNTEGTKGQISIKGVPYWEDGCKADGSLQQVKCAADGSPQIEAAQCSTGACQDGACINKCSGQAVPSPTNACYTVGTCDPATGIFPQVAKTCTGDQTCNTTTGVCESPNLCIGKTQPAARDLCYTVGACDPATGIFPQIAKSCTAGQTCNTTTGACESPNLCIGKSAPAPTNNCYTVGTCNPATGIFAQDAIVCPSGQNCNVANGRCESLCANTPAEDSCNTYACDAATGAVTPTVKKPQWPSMTCTVYTGECRDGIFYTKPLICPEGQTCNTANGACESPSLCIGKSAPSARDLCHTVGTCDPATGIFAQDTVVCPSGQNCNVTTGRCDAPDLCIGKAVPSARDLCHTVGTCDPVTGDFSQSPTVCPANQECRIEAGGCVTTSTTTRPPATRASCTDAGTLIQSTSAIFDVANAQIMTLPAVFTPSDLAQAKLLQSPKNPLQQHLLFPIRDAVDRTKISELLVVDPRTMKTRVLKLEKTSSIFVVSDANGIGNILVARSPDGIKYLLNASAIMESAIVDAVPIEQVSTLPPRDLTPAWSAIIPIQNGEVVVSAEPVEKGVVLVTSDATGLLKVSHFNSITDAAGKIILFPDTTGLNFRKLFVTRVGTKIVADAAFSPTTSEGEGPTQPTVLHSEDISAEVPSFAKITDPTIEAGIWKKVEVYKASAGSGNVNPKDAEQFSQKLSDTASPDAQWAVALNHPLVDFAENSSAVVFLNNGLSLVKMENGAIVKMESELLSAGANGINCGAIIGVLPVNMGIAGGKDLAVSVDNNGVYSLAFYKNLNQKQRFVSVTAEGVGDQIQLHQKSITEEGETLTCKWEAFQKMADGSLKDVSSQLVDPNACDAVFNTTVPAAPTSALVPSMLNLVAQWVADQMIASAYAADVTAATSAYYFRITTTDPGNIKATAQLEVTRETQASTSEVKVVGMEVLIPKREEMRAETADATTPTATLPGMESTTTGVGAQGVQGVQGVQPTTVPTVNELTGSVESVNNPIFAVEGGGFGCALTRHTSAPSPVGWLWTLALLAFIPARVICYRKSPHHPNRCQSARGRRH